MINEFYKEIGGSYNEVFERISNERIIVKFVFKFLDDSTFDQLSTSIKESNYADAFRYAHTLKGVCLNLGFSNLGITSELLTEALRNNDEINVQEVLKYFNEAQKEYNNLIMQIKILQEKLK